MLNEKEVAARLLKIGAVKLNPTDPFLWASGLYSPIYCDNRLILSYPNIRNEIKTSLAAKSTLFQPFDKVAGVATAGIAHGVLLADALNLPFVYVRSSAKKHGRKNRIEGQITPGERCLVVEDLVSTGGSSLQAVEVLQDAGCTVAGVLAIFSYGLEKAYKAFERVSCSWDTLSDYDSLMEVIISSGHMNEEQVTSLRNWKIDPVAWSLKISQ